LFKKPRQPVRPLTGSWRANSSIAARQSFVEGDAGRRSPRRRRVRRAWRSYASFRLVRTIYFPRSHNIKFLRSLAEDKDTRPIEAWPRESKVDRRRFELLKRADVKARYPANQEISADDLRAITLAVGALRTIVEFTSRARLDDLRQKAGLRALNPAFSQAFAEIWR
jgi:hypothetical protein